MADMLNSAALALNCSIGHLVGLFDTLAGQPPLWGAQMARQMLAEAGFTHVAIAQISADTGNNYYIATKR
jgi:hypothetical protein